MPMKNNRSASLPFFLLFVALDIWAIIIGMGIVRQPDGDGRKALLVVAVFTVFVGVWIWALIQKK